MELMYKRPDGTYIIFFDNNPYHVTKDDPMYEAAVEAEADLVAPLPPEPEIKAASVVPIEIITDPVEKLQQFLAANPDVASLLGVKNV